MSRQRGIRDEVQAELPNAFGVNPKRETSANELASSHHSEGDETMGPPVAPLRPRPLAMPIRIVSLYLFVCSVLACRIVPVFIRKWGFWGAGWPMWRSIPGRSHGCWRPVAGP